MGVANIHMYQSHSHPRMYIMTCIMLEILTMIQALLETSGDNKQQEAETNRDHSWQVDEVWHTQWLIQHLFNPWPERLAVCDSDYDNLAIADKG